MRYEPEGACLAPFAVTTAWGIRFDDITGDFATPESEAGLRYKETHSVPALAGFDHDGNLDLVITCVYDGRPTGF